jgi:tetratricopeptide (TPR) repeat protein
VALTALVLAVYWPAISFGYVNYDDPWYVVNNPQVRNGLSWDAVGWALTTTSVRNWHPMTWLSFMLDSSVLGDHPAGHHAVNIALHAANVLLLFGLLKMMTGMYWRSLLAAALLAGHPIHVESVAWISERKDVLSLFFALLAMIAYVRFVRRGAWWQFGLAMACFALGLMVKPMVLTLPALLLLLDVWPLERIKHPWLSPAFWRETGSLLFEKLPFFALSAISAAMTIRVQGVGHLPDGVAVPLAQRLANVVVSYVLYLEDLFWPTGLAALYPNLDRIGRNMWQPWQVAAAGTALLFITMLVLMAFRRRPQLAIGWFWYLGTMTPVIGFVPIGRQAMADRFAYMPFIGLYVMLAWIIADLVQRFARPVRAPIVACVLLAIAWLAVAAHRQVWVWKDSRTLFQHALDVTRDNWIMHINMARVLETEGDRDGAIREYETALTIFPDGAWVRGDYGLLLSRAGRPDEAEQSLRRAVADGPRHVPSYYNLGMVLMKRNQSEEGLEWFRRAIEVNPAHPDARMMLAVTLSQHGQPEEAVRQMEEALRLRPDKAPHWQPMLDAMKQGKSVPYP